MVDFPIYSNELRQLYLSYWFERLALHLLHRELPHPDDWFKEKGGKRFDFDDDHLAAYIEVKGASNTDALKLFESQFDAQLGELGFPWDKAYVWIFSYINRDDHGGKRMLKRTSGKSFLELSKFLARRTNTAFVVDINLLDALRRKNGVKHYGRDKSNSRWTLAINRTDLWRIAENPRVALAELGYNHGLTDWLPPGANTIRSRRITTCLDGNPVSFELMPLLPTGARTQFLRRLNGNVRHEA